MFFGTKPKISKMPTTVVKLVKLGELVIKRVPSSKYHGVNLDSVPSFHEHVEMIKRKTLGKIKLLSRVTPFLLKKLNIELHTTLIRPHFDYCDVAYGCLNQSDVLTLQRLQIIALKNILHAPRRTSTDYIHDVTEIERLADRKRIHVANEMYKVANALPTGIHSKNVCTNL